MTTKLRADRLETLAAFLDAFPAHDPARQFDLGHWYDDAYEDECYEKCGTVACACGWATTIPEFAAAGYALNGIEIPEFAGACGIASAELFFGLPRPVAVALFNPNLRFDDEGDQRPSPTAQAVAAVIREFLATGVVRPYA